MGIRVCVTLRYVILCAQSPSQETFLCIQHKSASLNFTEGEKILTNMKTFDGNMDTSNIKETLAGTVTPIIPQNSRIF